MSPEGAEAARMIGRHLAGELGAAGLERWAESRESPPAADPAVRDALAYLARPPSCGPARADALRNLARMLSEG